MKKVLYLFTVAILILAVVAPAAAAPFAQGPGPQRPDWPNADENPYLVHLPQVMHVNPGPYTVSGIVMNNFNTPLSGVRVSDGNGRIATTDATGRYRLTLPAGTYTLQPSKTGYTAKLKNNAVRSDAFTVNRDLSDRDFTMVSSVAAACREEFFNTNFEGGNGWNMLSGSAFGFTPYYYNGRSHSAGTRSAFTGVPQGAYQERASLSGIRSQQFRIPTDATSATLNVFMWPVTTDLANTTLSAKDAMMPSFGGEQAPRVPQKPDLTGLNTDDLTSPQAVDAFTTDIHYMFLIDGVTNQAIGQPILWQLTNDNAWVTILGGLDLLAQDWGSNIRNRWLKIEYGTFNDTNAFKSSAWFDDVTLEVCSPDIIPPAQLSCYHLQDTDAAGDGYVADWNGGFERPDVGWAPVGPEYYEPDWAQQPEIVPFAQLWSYRTGIPWNIFNQYPGEWQWSEGYHPIDLSALPAGSTVRLSAWMLPRSNYTGGPWMAPYDQYSWGYEGYNNNKSYLAMWDSQYMYLKGPTGRDEVDVLLEKWFAWNSAWWQYRTFDISAYRGQVVSAVFGTANNGWGNNSSLYVDNVDVEICTPLPGGGGTPTTTVTTTTTATTTVTTTPYPPADE